MAGRPRDILSLGMTSAALLVGALLVQGAGCIVDSESARMGNGTCDPAKNDKNPCTDYSCPEGIAKLTPVADGAGCALGPNAGVCSAGTCQLDCLATDSCACTNAAADCPPSTECISYTCEASKCTKTVKAGKELSEQVQGDCQTAICGVSGEQATSANNLDIPLAKEPICHIGVCAMGAPGEKPLDPGSACNDGSGNVCDGEGNCIACLDNGKKDGQETDVDCGPKCDKKCNGDPCAQASDCKNGTCSNGVCCDNECAGECQACNLPGKIGVCTNVPAGDKGGCGGAAEVCSYNQTCTNIGSANGEPCAQNNNCISGACVGPSGIKTCKQKDGPCTDNAECASDKCTNNTCVP